jgi:hypothetical protein
VPNGITSEIELAWRRPRSVRKSCSSSAVSLGAGGHLNDLGKAEDERVAFVDQDDVDVAAEFLGEDRRQLEAAKAGAKDDYASGHERMISRCYWPRGAGFDRYSFDADSLLIGVTLSGSILTIR